MIEFNTENAFELEDPAFAKAWLLKVIEEEEIQLGEINYIFCDDDYLHKINLDFLQHDTLTDIISFDYTTGNVISGDIYISTQRVADNAKDFKTLFKNELSRVMVHGILHYCGYKDKSDEDVALMRSKEDYYISKSMA